MFLDYLSENPCIVLLIAIALYILFSGEFHENFALHKPYDYRKNPEQTQSGDVKFDWLYYDKY